MYILAPPPVSVKLPPAQTVADELVAVTVGSAFTVTVVVAELVQPFEPVPVTVKVIVAVGTNETALVTPPDHAYVLAPPPVSVALAPIQTAADELVAVTVGEGLTVIETVAVLLHPLVPAPVTV